ncbi:LysR family transcriptional regulator [Reinekea sp.]|jgi:DNA-binding transcriptional LysR family regulator|uniref:LysR family transcriptional regulator n=1 Tax=Reinekea sp. TaxID=1970455 RepID=UPI00398A0AD0
MSKLTEIEAYIQVAQLGSFTEAAEVLELSRGRVSQLIQRLETRLDVSLMTRTTRKISLTPEGEQFLISCREGMNQLNSAETNLKMMSQRLSGPVRINSVGGIFGESFLSLALSELVVDHPELSVTINYSSSLVDFNRDPVDLVLRIGHAPAEDVNSIFLGEVHHVLCASPTFVNRYGYPESPDDLTRLPTVCGTPKIWELEHCKSGNKQVITPQAHWRSGNTHAQCVAAKAGIGISRILTLVAQPELDAGNLVTVLPEWKVEPTSLWLMWRSQGEMPLRIKMVRDHIINRMAELSNFKHASRKVAY